MTNDNIVVGQTEGGLQECIPAHAESWVHQGHLCLTC